MLHKENCFIAEIEGIFDRKIFKWYYTIINEIKVLQNHLTRRVVQKNLFQRAPVGEKEQRGDQMKMALDGMGRYEIHTGIPVIELEYVCT